MKKVLSFIGCALFVAAMAVSCKNAPAEEAVDTIVEETVEETVATEAAATTTCDMDRQAMLDAAAEAGRAKCNCYKTDAASVEACIKSILAQSYAAYQDNDEFKAAMEAEYQSCVKEKVKDAAKDAADKGIKEGAKALSNALNKKN